MVTIIGNGTVGRALGKAIKIEPMGKSDEIINDDVIFICVPTPTKKKQDLSNIEQAILRIKSAKLIVIRSTILPGTTDNLQKQNDIPIMFVPEFGKEKTMDHDIANPECYIFGMTEKSMPFGGLALDVLPKAPKLIRVNAIAAEYVKYMSNIWKYNQVILANTFYDWIDDELLYQQAVNAILNLSDIPKWGWKVKNEGYRGVKGKCLPKDLEAALSQFPNKIWKEIKKYNNKLIKEENVSGSKRI